MSSSGDQIVIIGGGVIGLCSAVELAEAGHHVVVVDRHDLASNASCGNAGLIAIGHPPLPRPGLMRQSLKFLLDPTSPLYIPFRFDSQLFRWLWNFRKACAPSQFEQSMRVLAELGKLSARRFAERADDPSLDFECHRAGLIDVCLSKRGMNSLVHEAEHIARHGLRYEVIDGDQIRRDDPMYLDTVYGGILYPDSASASPAQFMRAMHDHALARGVTIRDNSAVRSIDVQERRFRSIELQSGEIVSGSSLLIAAGAWSTELAARIGVRIPLQPAKGYHVNLQIDEPCPRRAGVLSESFIAATPMDGGLRLAGTLEFSGMNHRFRPRRVDMLTTGARRYLRGIEQATVTSAWCGLRPCTADGLPVIGALPGIENAFIATGHAMLGFGLGPGTAVVVARIMSDQDAAMDLSPMSPYRFT